MKLAMYTLTLAALAALTQPAQAGKCAKSQVAQVQRHYVAAEAEKPKTIVETAAGIEDFSTLVAAVKAGGLVETLSGKGPFVLFSSALNERQYSEGFSLRLQSKVLSPTVQP